MSEKTLFDHQPSELKENIRKILVNHPDTRDNDNLLVSMVWEQDIRKQGDQFPMSLTSVGKFFGMLSDPLNRSKITSYKSVVRYRSMLQAEFPELQGKTHEKREQDSETIAENVAISGEPAGGK